MHLDDVVIGHSLSSLLYAYNNGYYFLSVFPHGPYFYETNLYYENPQQIWREYRLKLSLLGKALVSSDTSCPQIRGQKLVLNSTNGIQEYSFERCHVASGTRINHENEIMAPSPPSYKVIDDFEVRRLGKKYNNIRPIYRPSVMLGREIHFYTSSRISGASYITDCIVISELTYNMLHDIEYSDVAVKFLLESEMRKTRDIQGKKMGRYKSGKVKYHKPEATHCTRRIIEKDNNEYIDTDIVKFITLSSDGEGISP